VIRAVIIAGAVGIAACGGPQSEAGNGSAPADGVEVRLEPGEWEVTSEPLNEGDGAKGIAALDGEGSEEDKVKGLLAGMRSVERMCITQQKAAELFAEDPSEGCKREGQGWRNGRISTKVTCTQADAPQTSVHEVSGSYGARTFDVTQRLDEAFDGETTTIRNRTTGRRIGDCPAGK
jgi:hypothetical protein